jgi:hypothetical protein
MQQWLIIISIYWSVSLYCFTTVLKTYPVITPG